jgi:hypothetical protein
MFLTFAAAELYKPLSGEMDSQEIWDTLMPILVMIASEAGVLGTRGQEMRGEVLDMVTGCLWGVVKLESTAIVSCCMSRVCDRQVQALMIAERDSAADSAIEGRPSDPSFKRCQEQSHRYPGPRGCTIKRH